MSLNEYSVWTECVSVPAIEPHPLPPRADVAIIGGGITGLAAAHALARRGAQVVVLEARTLGWGASTRNGGMVLTGLKLGPAQLIAKYGLETARRMFAASLLAIDYVEQLVTSEQIECSFSRSGHLVVAAKPAHERALAGEAELLVRSFGHTTRLIPHHMLQNEIGSAHFYGGLLDQTSAGLNPARYVAGLVQAAMRAGAALFEHTPAIELARTGSNFCIKTARGTLLAGALLAATGGYTGPVIPQIRRRVIPIGSYIIATEPLPEALAHELVPNNRMIFDTKHFLYYFRLTPERRMLFGGRARFFPETPTTIRQSAGMLQSAMQEIFPQLRGIPVTHAWGGTIDATFDMMPHAGEMAGIHYALGYAGHGVAMASYLGALSGMRLAGEAVDQPFRQPLPGVPFSTYNGEPWFLPLAGAWYKLLDYFQ